MKRLSLRKRIRLKLKSGTKQKEVNALEAQLRAKTIDKTIQLLVNDVQADRVLLGAPDFKRLSSHSGS